MLPACPVCHSAKTQTRKTIGHYAVLECEDCGLFWTPNVSDAELGEFYGQHYFAGSQEFGYADYLKTETAQRLNARQLLGVITKHRAQQNGLANAKLLDVGCAHGFLVDEAAKQGADASGVDYSPEACRYAQTELQRDVRLGSLQSAAFEPGYFDAVTSIGSIEHMNDPIGMVEEVARVTKPGGIFVVTTIDTKSLFRVYRFKPPEHLYYFSHDNLALLLGQKGFKVEAVKANITYHLAGEALGLFASAILGPSAGLDRLLDKMPWKDTCLKIPNNEMLMVARRH